MRIEAHYFVNNAPILKDIPGYIIHGRYDMFCPLEYAHKLHKAWPNADFFVVQGTGYSAGEAGITVSLIKANNDMLKKRGVK